MLANLYLDVFDRAMLRAGYRVIRYSDDFAVPAASRADAEHALTVASTELEDLRLEVNSGKSIVVSFDEGVPFLGETTTSSTVSRGELLSHPVETVVYLDRQGATVRSRGDRLVVTHPAGDGNDADQDGDKAEPAPAAESLLRLNLRRVRQVVCFGRVGLTSPFLHAAAERGIDVVLLTESGGLVGRFAHPAAGDSRLRRAQYRAAGDENTAVRFASAFVDGKLRNMRVALLRAANRRDDAASFAAAETVAAAADALADAGTLDTVLGHEGAGTREYFQALRRLADPVWGFEGRMRRPPPDPINAMLSYGYTLLANEAMAAVETAGLDPMLGFLHQHRWGRPSLALDLMEEFRPVTVDVAMWRIIEPGRIRPEQFTIEPPLGCRMAPDAKHAFIEAYEKRMLTLTTHQQTGRRVSYRIALHLQAKAVARALLDPAAPYTPHRWK